MCVYSQLLNGSFFYYSPPPFVGYDVFMNIRLYKRYDCSWLILISWRFSSLAGYIWNPPLQLGCNARLFLGTWSNLIATQQPLALRHTTVYKHVGIIVGIVPNFY